MDSSSQEVAPPSAMNAGNRWYVFGGILIVVLALLISLYYLDASVRLQAEECMVAISMPADLKEAVFVTRSGTGYEVNGLGLQAVSTPTIEVAGRASPNGTLTTYMQATLNGQAAYISASPTVEYSAWKVYVQKKDGEAAAIGTGYAPAFLDNEHIAYFDTKGIEVYDVTTGNTLNIQQMASTSLGAIVQYSPDRTLVMWTDTAHAQSIVARITPVSYTPLHVFTGLDPLILTDSSVYQLLPSPQGSALWQYDIDGGHAKKVLTFPPSFIIQSIWP